MPNVKPIIKVKPTEEKRLYRIMKELERDRESIVKNMDVDWHGTMRKLGVRTKKLIDKNGDPYIEEWKHIDAQNHKIEQKMFRIQKDIEVTEIPGNDISFFHFKRRRII